MAKPVWWHKGGTGKTDFVEGNLPGVNNPFYAIYWADLDSAGVMVCKPLRMRQFQQAISIFSLVNKTFPLDLQADWLLVLQSISLNIPFRFNQSGIHNNQTDIFLLDDTETTPSM